MTDRISALPNTLISHILSFLPTQQAVTTSVLSKRWKNLWQAISALNFDDSCYSQNKDTYPKFIQLVDNALLFRDTEQTIKKFKLVCTSSQCNSCTLKKWIRAANANQCKVEHFNISLPSTISLPIRVFSSTTLVVLKLRGLYVQNNPSSVRLPSLKILYLRKVYFLQLGYVVEFLSVCPNLEVLVMKRLTFKEDHTTVRFKPYLPKLVKADVSESNVILSLQLFNNVEFLRADLVPRTNEHISARDFSNLTYLEIHLLCDNWNLLVKLLHSCPRLQALVIYKLMCVQNLADKRAQNWALPECVSECLISKLKTFRFCEYGGKKDEFQFVKLIMQNARVLRKITICCSTLSSHQEQIQMFRDISSYPRVSSASELYFEWWSSSNC